MDNKVSKIDDTKKRPKYYAMLIEDEVKVVKQNE